MSEDEQEIPTLSKAELNVLELLFHVPDSDKWWSAAEIARGGRGQLPAGSRPNMAKGTAITHAASLHKKGLILAKETQAVRKADPSPHYYLSTKPRDAMVIVARYLDALLATGSINRAYSLLVSPFAKRALNEDFVREVLAVHGATALVKLPVSAFKIRIFKEDPEAAETVPTATDVPFRPPGVSIAEAVRQVADKSRATTLDEDRHIVEASLREHYEMHEGEQVILPLLALITISPQALVHLLTPWEPFSQVKDRVRGLVIGRIEHVLFSMVYGALYDLASSRQTPGAIVLNAEGSPRQSGSLAEGPPLLALTLYGGATIQYSAGFSAPIMVMPGPYGLVRMTQNPADGWARATWVRPPAREAEDSEPSPADEPPA